MVLIIGGAYQGKLDFAKTAFTLSEDDIFTCTSLEIDFSKRCIYQIETFAFHHPDPVEYFRAHRQEWENSVLILRDIFCGVVPMGAENRLWRQKTGRLAQYLAQEAQQVSRVFCGLEQKLK